MKIAATYLFVLVSLAGCCPKQPVADIGVYDVRVSLKPSEKGVQYSILGTVVSYDELGYLFGEMTNDWENMDPAKKYPDKNVVYYVDPRLSVTNIFPALLLAEQYQVKNVILKLQQAAPPAITNDRRVEDMIYYAK